MANTRLVVKGAALPPGFKGSLNKFYKAIIDRLIIEIPGAGLQWQIGGLKPTSNVGPWLKNGTQAYVWSEDDKDYVPLDISESLPTYYWEGSTTPTETVPPYWLYSTGTVAAWRYYNGTAWVPFLVETNSGPTADRPASPADLERFYDEDIECEIWYERGKWRTVSGTTGDVKAVLAEDTDSALTKNPGWKVVDSDLFGRSIVVAGAGANLTTRDPLDTWGTDSVKLTKENLPAHKHGMTTPEGGLTGGRVDRGSPSQSVITWSGAPNTDQGPNPSTVLKTGKNYGDDNDEDPVADGPGVGFDCSPPSVALVHLYKT